MAQKKVGINEVPKDRDDLKEYNDDPDGVKEFCDTNCELENVSRSFLYLSLISIYAHYVTKKNTKKAFWFPKGHPYHGWGVACDEANKRDEALDSKKLRYKFVMKHKCPRCKERFVTKNNLQQHQKDSNHCEV